MKISVLQPQVFYICSTAHLPLRLFIKAYASKADCTLLAMSIASITSTRDWAVNNLPELQRSISPSHVEAGWQNGITVPENGSIPRQVFEKIYLNPPIDVKGDFRNILVRTLCQYGWMHFF